MGLAPLVDEHTYTSVLQKRATYSTCKVQAATTARQGHRWVGGSKACLYLSRGKGQVGGSVSGGCRPNPTLFTLAEPFLHGGVRAQQYATTASAYVTLRHCRSHGYMVCTGPQKSGALVDTVSQFWPVCTGIPSAPLTCPHSPAPGTGACLRRQPAWVPRTCHIHTLQ